jgi:mRNA interferase HigB
VENCEYRALGQLLAVRSVYPAADQVECCLVFDVKGNKHRLIWRVTYANQWQRGTLLVKHFLTHADYDKNDWKEDCK